MQQRQHNQAHFSALELFDNAMAVCRAQIQELHIQSNSVERSLLTSQEDNKLENDLSLYLLKRVRKKVSVPAFQVASNDGESEDKHKNNISSKNHGQTDSKVSTLQQQSSTHQLKKSSNPSSTMQQQNIPQSRKTLLSPPPEQALDESCMIFSENMIHKRMAESISLGNEGNNNSISQVSQAKHAHKQSEKHQQNSSHQAIQYQFATLKDMHISEENLRLLNQMTKITLTNNSLQATPQQSNPSSSNPSSNPPSSPVHEQSSQPKFIYPKITIASPKSQSPKTEFVNQEQKPGSRNSSTSVADPSPPLIPSLSTRLSSQSETYLRVYSQMSSPQQASPPNASLTPHVYDHQHQQVGYANTNIKYISGTVQPPQYPHYSPSFLPNSPLNSFYSNNPMNYSCQQLNNNTSLYSSLKVQTPQQILIQQQQQYNSNVLGVGCHPILEKLSTQGKNEHYDHLFTSNSHNSHNNVTSSGYNAGSSSGFSRGSVLGGNNNINNTTSILNNNNNNKNNDIDDFQNQQQSSVGNSIKKSKDQTEKDCNNEEIIQSSKERRISSQFKSAFSVGDEEELAEKQKEILKEKSLKYLNQDFLIAKRTQSMELQDELFHPHKSVNSNPSESGEATLVFESLKSQKCFASILQHGQSNSTNNPTNKIDELFPIAASSQKGNISDISETCTSVDLNE